MNVFMNAETLPVLGRSDVVVIGGSFAGIAAAIRLAKGGKQVVLIESRTYLGTEMTAKLMPWIELNGATDSALPELIEAVMAQQNMGALLHESYTGSIREGQGLDDQAASISCIPMHPDRLKRGLEDILLERGIEFVYSSIPIALHHEHGRLNGIVVANKSGRQVIRAECIVDATETAITAALMGEPLARFPHGSSACYYRTLEFTGAVDVQSGEMRIPEELGLLGNTIRVRFGCRGEGHVYVTFGLSLQSGNTMKADRDREVSARFIGMKVASYLTKQVPGFGKAVLSFASHELSGPYAFGPEGDLHGWEATSDNESMQGPWPGLLCLYRDVYVNGNAHLLNPVSAAALGEAAALLLLEGETLALGRTLQEAETVITESGADPERAWINRSANSEEGEKNDYEISSISSFREEWAGEEAEVAGMGLPVLKKANVLVVGGGSSGASASITAGFEGMDTVLVELNPGLGGTGTYGGVDSYWFGRRGGYAARIHEAVQQVQSSIGYRGHKWNIEAKAFALLQLTEEAGTDALFNCTTWGTVKQGNRICGIAAATRWGPVVLLADVVIDASGDGDAAAFAGAEYVYGSSKDHTVMWYSLSQYKAPSKLQNNFTSMVDVSSILDYTRAILAGRRRGEECHDHGIYVATRESRHIVGDAVMQLPDQLLHRRWPDVINVHFSNHDIKGVSGADWVNIGLIPPNLEIEIPYRMLLPKGLDGILVAGKAVSATHDALPAIRMQSDLENLGAVCALAAVQAVGCCRSPREIDIKLLQQRLGKEGLIPEDAVTRKLSPYRYTDEELTQLVDSIEGDVPLYEYSNMRMNEIYRGRLPFVEICSLGQRIIPYLESALTKASERKKIVLAQALSMLGARSGVQVLIDAITKELQGGRLPLRTAEIMYVQLPPDHGAMPEAANWLYSLAAARDPRSLTVWQRVAGLLHPGEEDFKDTLQGIYYYIDAICQGAERLGSRDAVPVLLKLHNIPELRGQSCKRGAQPDYFLERRSMLELAIGRALARSGSMAGYEILIDYLDDSRSLLGRSALLELHRLSGKRYGKMAKVWLEWLHRQESRLTPQPLAILLDIECNSEDMLRCID
ncbi:FAD-dependent oxidoreductase [Paenibacillus sp. Dod16]|uniref:FAD-dependent oxidoreductase n=1 Tax=Paenibacillus sp. Dod16 TaxID=3416392 RepID=UPI003CF5F73A